jgi:hypothetical protein
MRVAKVFSYRLQGNASLYISKALMMRILESILENFLVVKRKIDMYNEPGEDQMPPEHAEHRKEAQ